MRSAPYEQRRGEFLVSTERALLDVPLIHAFLTHTYWSPGVPLETVQRAIEHSLCFGLYRTEEGRPARQVGFARVVTDCATFGYLADVFVDEGLRGQGLGQWLMEVLFAHPQLQGFRRFMLATRDAHGLYAKHGFTPLSAPDRFMERWDPDVYRR
ncbi:GNAT family N-acetyltransferase [Aggregicoccus sp. 17bor-14]|uniref:GNAT family N-acetyltransferase n=1 Tax=Myxococcaceae TaxID=31 RepID=UPI00129CB854|nr:MULTISPECIES: GNAT family N-acetyltransferase [Myxococcaceae]MBF5041290.1 GNAT family N-acetyltransferase [Simulacricoccus sp. 17bor-14]MRI87076.1 GNAT family N-acetyltransferase [Aggregicoccus sp. 17bor-14]